MGDLSEHFSRSEFACKCGCGGDTIDAETLLLCEEVREINGGHPITPNSGFRCIAYNRAIGSNDDSQHPKGRAADLPVDDPDLVYDELCKRHPSKYGFGKYATFVHVDSRTDGPTRWEG